MPLANTHELISKIAVVLFEPEERRLNGVLEQLIADNRDQHPGKPHDGFTFNGKCYDIPGLPKGPKTRVSLHASLVERMESYLGDHEKVWTDRYFITQLLTPMLIPCNDLQDVRDVLPNCVVDTLPELKGFARKKLPAFTIKPNVRLYRQFERLLPRIEAYAMSKLLY